jgi:hypothetical protein
LSLLPSGSAALTRRAKEHSRRYAVVLKWSRARKRYERQGLLVGEEALVKAEAECLADLDARERVSEKQSASRSWSSFAKAGRAFFPGCPTKGEQAIAELHEASKVPGAEPGSIAGWWRLEYSFSQRVRWTRGSGSVDSG